MFPSLPVTCFNATADTAAAVALHVARGEADAGIAIDGAGLGSTIAANKVPGVRAAMCLNETLARYARQHNGANVLALGSTLVTPHDGFVQRRVGRYRQWEANVPGSDRYRLEEADVDPVRRLTVLCRRYRTSQSDGSP